MDINQLKIYGQYLLPKRALTRLVGYAAGAKLGKITTLAIQNFAKFYRINLQEADGKITDYKTFNDFFARRLKSGARSIDNNDNSIVFPADGRISAFGELKENIQLQAKGHYFSTDALLASETDSALFDDGKFITVYLSPSDYHRVHIPFAGKLIKMTYVPGELFSVNPLYMKNIPELFSRNERVVCIFETPIGKMAIILVGAAIVRSIYMNWCGIVAPNKANEPQTYEYPLRDISFHKGDEIGKFMMGSTVICLFEKDKIKFDEALQIERHIQMGQKMGTIL